MVRAHRASANCLFFVNRKLRSIKSFRLIIINDPIFKLIDFFKIILHNGETMALKLDLNDVKLYFSDTYKLGIPATLT